MDIDGRCEQNNATEDVIYQRLTQCKGDECMLLHSHKRNDGEKWPEIIERRKQFLIDEFASSRGL